MMQELRGWAMCGEVPFVDVLRRLDDRRDHLLTWVHLTPGGNQVVAAALADTILELCAAEARATG